jgi:hypothetical protein
VNCPKEWHQLRSDEIGLGPWGGTDTITIRDGKVVGLRRLGGNFTDPDGFSKQMWEPFAEWIRANYPDDGAIMYQDWPVAHGWAITEESIALWEQRSREYVEVVRGTSG